MPAEHAMRAVAQVGAQASAGVDGRLNLGRIGSHMAQRNYHARIGCAANKIGRFGVLWGQREQANPTIGRCLKSLKFIPIGRATVI
jgi:hypothetical protein